MDSLILWILAMGAFLMLRNCVAHSIQVRAINMAWAQDRHDVYFDGPSYEAIMFNPLIWTTRQAYPELYASTRTVDAK